MRNQNRRGSMRSTMSSGSTDIDDDTASIISFQHNMACQDIAATALASQEDWIEFKAALKNSSVHTNAGVREHMQSTVRDQCKSEELRRQLSADSIQSGVSDVSMDSIFDPELPSHLHNKSINLAELVKSSADLDSDNRLFNDDIDYSDDEDDDTASANGSGWYRRGSIGAILPSCEPRYKYNNAAPAWTKQNAEDRKPLSQSWPYVSGSSNSDYSLASQPSSDDGLLCDFGGGEPDVSDPDLKIDMDPTVTQRASWSPGRTRMVGKVEECRRASTSVMTSDSISQAFSSFMSKFEQEATLSGELIQDFGPRRSKRNPSFLQETFKTVLDQMHTPNRASPEASTACSIPASRAA